MSGSFREGFGEGFDSMPSWKEQRFDMLADRAGVSIVVVELTQTGTDSYGNPIFIETETPTKGFAEQIRAREKQLMAGTLAEADMRFYLKRGTTIAESGYEIEYMSRRYKIIGDIEYGESHITVYARRKAS